MHVRHATIFDAEAVTVIFNHAIANTDASLWYDPRPVAELRAEIEAASDAYPWLVAENEQGDVVGWAMVKPWNKRDGYRHTVETTIYLAHHARGKGVGRMLYDELFRLILDQGYQHVIAGVSLPNPASVRLHESMGMTRVALFPGIGTKFGRRVDVGYWHRAFENPAIDLSEKHR
ncbi:MAG: N-acetyltransferase family protein [Planctomycetota bacterium]